MPKNTVWIGESNPEEQGSFCNTDSRNEYQNGSIIEAVRQEHNAIEREEEVVWLDAPMDSSDTYNVPEDQRFNILRTETDSQGVSRPPKFRPGR